MHKPSGLVIVHIEVRLRPTKQEPFSSTLLQPIGDQLSPFNIQAFIREKKTGNFKGLFQDQGNYVTKKVLPGPAVSNNKIRVSPFCSPPPTFFTEAGYCVTASTCLFAQLLSWWFSSSRKPPGRAWKSPGSMNLHERRTVQAQFI